VNQASIPQNLDTVGEVERRWITDARPVASPPTTARGNATVEPTIRHRPQRSSTRNAAGDELLTIADVCAELGISRATFYRWRTCRKGPASLRLPNGTVRIRRSALTAFITACEETTR
jgi:predicted DNA-binding transcriptional regulator AlpA